MKNTILKTITLIFIPISFAFASCGWIPEPPAPPPSQNTTADLPNGRITNISNFMWMNEYGYDCYTYNPISGFKQTVWVLNLTVAWNPATQLFDILNSHWVEMTVFFTDLGLQPGNIDEQVNQGLSFEINSNNGYAPQQPAHFTCTVEYDNMSNSNVLVASSYKGVY